MSNKKRRSRNVREILKREENDWLPKVVYITNNSSGEYGAYTDDIQTLPDTAVVGVYELVDVRTVHRGKTTLV